MNNSRIQRKRQMFMMSVLLILMLLFVMACGPTRGIPSERTTDMSQHAVNQEKARNTPDAQSINAVPEASPMPAVNRSRQFRIGFSMDTLLEDRWVRDRDLFIAAAGRAGATVEVKAASGDDLLQVSQSEMLIKQGVDVLVIVPHHAEAAASIVSVAHRANIKVIAYDRLIKNADLDLYISFDNERIGELQAEAILQKVPKGNYVYIGGAETDNNAHLLKKGVLTKLQPHIDNGDIRIVYDQWTKDWKPSEAKKNITEAFESAKGKIDAVICANDATAGAVIEVLEKKGLAGMVPVTGQDADLSAVRRVVQGKQLMTIYKPIRMLTGKAATLALQLARGETPEPNRRINNGKTDVPSVLLEPVVVVRENVEESVIADGFHRKEDVFE